MYIALIVILILGPMALAGLSLAPYVPMSKNDLPRVNRIAGLKKGETFFEIGCGDGKVSHYIAKNNPDSKIIGVEYAFFVYLIAKLRSIIFPLKNLEIKLGNAFKYDFGKYDVIYLYGMPDALEKKIKPKFMKETKKHTKLISYVFKIDNWEGYENCDKIEKRNSIYMYRKD